LWWITSNGRRRISVFLVIGLRVDERHGRKMTKRASHLFRLLRIPFLSLAAAGIFAATRCPALGQSQAAAASPTQSSSPVLEVAAIKPVKNPDPNNMRDHTEGRRLFARNTTVRDLIMLSYELDPQQIQGGPAWMATDEYDIDAEAVEGVQLNNEREEKTLIQELLADRFKLTFHHEQRTLAVYLLVVAKSGAKLKLADRDEVENSGCEHLGACTFTKRTLTGFSRFMQFVVLDRPVVNKTGIAGEFDFSLNWTPDESQFSRMGIQPRPPADNATAPPPLFEAIEEQLGLKLEPEKMPAEVLVIDKVERPTEN
jgi:bla regulator protein blaR1